MYDASTHLQLAAAEHLERTRHAQRANRAARVVRLRRLDRRAAQIISRARLVRLAIG